MVVKKASMDIKVTNTQGVVIGENNHIYQYFKASENSSIASKHIGFLPTIKEKTEYFVGREFVFNALDNFIQHNRSGYFVILGEPGIGKTSLLAQLVKTRGCVHHFNIAQQNICTPRQFLANACAQLIARYNLHHDSIPDEALNDSVFLSQCLEEAASNPENWPVLLAVDALDESERTGLPIRANALFLPTSLPDGVYVIVTSRPLDDLKLQVSNRVNLCLKPSTAENLLDVRQYIENTVQANHELKVRIQTWGVHLDNFVETLLRKSEGNFIYLRYVLIDIAKGKFTHGTVHDLPQGLRDYYRNHWNQMQIAKPDEFEVIYAPIICMLAVVREPVTVEHLYRWTNKSLHKIRHAIAQWREFLEESEAASSQELKYKLYHTSFQDFLKSVVNLRLYDEMIARYYLERLKGAEESNSTINMQIKRSI